jgi:butyrate kinase
MSEKELILVINPGSTSTKIAVFDGDKPVLEEEIMHDPDVVMSFKTRQEDYQFRRDTVARFLEDVDFDPMEIKAIVGRGGFMQPVEGGVYKVDNKMLDDIENKAPYEHPSNLGAPLAFELGKKYNSIAYTVDPVVVDEMWDIARISGFQEILRRSVFHALNIRAVARIASEKYLNKKYSSVNLIVVHMGGGISVTAHLKGKIVDVNNALLGMGPFSPQRAGALPIGELIRVCFSGEYTEKELKTALVKNAGLRGYLGTNDAIEIEEWIEDGDEYAELIYRALAYQTAKEVGAYATVLKGDVDAIVFTGGLSKSDILIEWFEESLSFIAPIYIIPGQKEMETMAGSVYRIMKGEEEANVYKPKEILDPSEKFKKSC